MTDSKYQTNDFPSLEKLYNLKIRPGLPLDNKNIDTIKDIREKSTNLMKINENANFNKLDTIHPDYRKSVLPRKSSNNDTKTITTSLKIPPKLPTINVPTVKPELPERKMTSPEREIELPSKKIQLPESKVKLPPKKIQLPERKVTLPPKKIELPSKKIELPSKKIELPSKKIELLPKKIELPEREIELPPRKIQLPTSTRKIELPTSTRKIQLPKKIELSKSNDEQIRENDINIISVTDLRPKTPEIFNKIQTERKSSSNINKIKFPETESLIISKNQRPVLSHIETGKIAKEDELTEKQRRIAFSIDFSRLVDDVRMGGKNNQYGLKGAQELAKQIGARPAVRKPEVNKYIRIRARELGVDI